MHLTPSGGYKYIVQAHCSLMHCSTLHSPTFSAGFRWTHWNPADFAGLQICHILSHGGSAGVRWSPVEKKKKKVDCSPEKGVRRSPPESTGLE